MSGYIGKRSLCESPFVSTLPVQIASGREKSFIWNDQSEKTVSTLKCSGVCKAQAYEGIWNSNSIMSIQYKF